MSSKTVCQVARSWVDVGSFHTLFLMDRVFRCRLSPGISGYTLVLKIRFKIILQATPGSSKWSFSPQVFPPKHCMHLSPIRATYTVCLSVG
jgi:hypothetical protein